MANKKTARRALFSSIISLILCCAMLVGTTFAWFTDSVTSAGNIIKSGTLDVTMEWADGKEDPANATWKDASEGAIFKSTLWEPGYTEVRHIKIANEGTLALQYQVKIVANGTVSNLADVIDVYYFDPAEQIDVRSKLVDDKKMGTLTNALAGMSSTATGKLESEESVTLTLGLKMQETAGNEYQNLSIGSDFSIILLATQVPHETDSFDDQYDKDAAWPTYAQGSGTLAANAAELVIDAKAEGASEPVATVTVPKAALEDENAASQVVVVPTVLDANVTVANDESAKTFDISVTNIADDNEALIKAEMTIESGLTGVKVFHKDTAMAESTGATEGYNYDSATGKLTIWTKSFSPFTVVYDDNTIQATDAPPAIVTELEDKAIVAKDMGEITLDCAYTFLPGQTKAECEESGYAKWHADFVIKVDKDVTTNVAGLAGYYSAWCELIDHQWVAIDLSDTELVADEEFRLVAGMLNGGTINYGEICEYAVREENLINGFLCGAYADDSMEGVTLTVELRLYEIDETQATQSTTACETGKYITIGTYTHTFDGE